MADPADLGSPLSYAVEVLAAQDDQDLESAAGRRFLAALGPRLRGARYLLSFLELAFDTWGCGVGSHCSFCGTVTGPFSEIEGLFTVRICIPCLEVRQARPDTLLGLHDPGQPWEQWGCPIDGCGRWVLGPWDLEGHTTAEHPDWTATYEPNPDGLANEAGMGAAPPPWRRRRQSGSGRRGTKRTARCGHDRAHAGPGPAGRGRQARPLSLALVVILAVIPPVPTAANQTALNGIPTEPDQARTYWSGLSGRWAVIS